MFNWKSELGKEIVAMVDSLREEGMRDWHKIAYRVNDRFDIDFHPQKIRKGWRMHGTHNMSTGLVDSVSREGNYSSFVKQYNTGEATSKGQTIKTLDDLISACEINLDIWKIDKHVINKWEVKAKDRDVFPLFQVKAWLSKIVADETKFPVIEPVQFNVPKATPVKWTDNGIKKALIIPDAQVGFKRDIYKNTLEPFHDRRAMDLVVQIAEHTNPDRIILLGDMLDLPDWSDKFIRSPEMYWTTQPAIIELAWWIARLKIAAPNVAIDYLEGNHEYRMRKTIINHLIAAYDLRPAGEMEAPAAMSIENLLGLPKMGVRFWGNYPNDEVWITNDLRCRHGDIARKGGGNTSKAILQESFVNEIYGHSHRFEMSCKTIGTSGGMKTFAAFSPGTLARLDGIVPSVRAQEDWQQGFAMVYYDDHGFNIVPTSIDNGRCIYDGKVFTGQEYVDRLDKETGWKF